MKPLETPINTGTHNATVSYNEKDAAEQAEIELPPSDHGEKSETPAANIVFVGRRELKNAETGELEMVDAEPPKSITDGREKIKLPSAEEQVAGFYHPKARQIIRCFPKFYKEPVSKGR